jgi:hypothetical protein
MPADNLDFTAPGVAAVRWELEGKLVLVEWEGWSNSKEFAALLAAELQALTENHGAFPWPTAAARGSSARPTRPETKRGSRLPSPPA